MLRFSLAAIAALFLAATAFGQSQVSITSADRMVADENKNPAGGNKKLKPNEKIEDSKGRSASNDGTNSNGRLHVRYTGRLSETPRGSGCYVASGEISSVTNPSSQGTNGPINVDTNGESTTINLNRNGTNPGGNITTNVTGGNATININGNHNDYNVGGTGNAVNVGGNNNDGSGGTGTAGSGVGTGGTVTQGGRGNSFNSNGGSWIVRN